MFVQRTMHLVLLVCNRTRFYHCDVVFVLLLLRLPRLPPSSHHKCDTHMLCVVIINHIIPACISYICCCCVYASVTSQYRKYINIQCIYHTQHSCGTNARNVDGSLCTSVFLCLLVYLHSLTRFFYVEQSK